LSAPADIARQEASVENDMPARAMSFLGYPAGFVQSMKPMG